MIRLFTITWAKVPYKHRWPASTEHGPAFVTTDYAAGRTGLLINKRALWVGVHFSAWNSRVCINLLPCVTLWVTMPGGIEP